MMTPAPQDTAKFISSVSKARTSMAAPALVFQPPISSWTRATRSSTVNIGPLPALLATATISRSTIRAARWMMS